MQKSKILIAVTPGALLAGVVVSASPAKALVPLVDTLGGSLSGFPTGVTVKAQSFDTQSNAFVIKNVEVRVGSSSSGNKRFDLLIFDDNNGSPGASVAALGTFNVDFSTSSTLYETINIQGLSVNLIPSSRYYLVVRPQSGNSGFASVASGSCAVTPPTRPFTLSSSGSWNQDILLGVYNALRIEAVDVPGPLSAVALAPLALTISRIRKRYAQ